VIRQRLIILWKALLLKDKMNTQTGKQIALERHRFMEILLHSFTRNGMGSKVVVMQHVFWFAIIVIYNLYYLEILKGLFYLVFNKNLNIKEVFCLIFEFCQDSCCLIVFIPVTIVSTTWIGPPHKVIVRCNSLFFRNFKIM
jgi:hypothetical protein